MYAELFIHISNKYIFLTDSRLWNKEVQAVRPEGGPFINRQNALSYLQKRGDSWYKVGQAKQGIVCECCIHQCSIVEWEQYCAYGDMDKRNHLGFRYADTPVKRQSNRPVSSDLNVEKVPVAFNDDASRKLKATESANDLSKITDDTVDNEWVKDLTSLNQEMPNQILPVSNKEISIIKSTINQKIISLIKRLLRLESED